MTVAMPFLQKPILLSYDPRPWGRRLLLFFVFVEDKRGLPARFSAARGYKKLTVEFFAVLWYPLPSETMIAEDSCHV